MLIWSARPSSRVKSKTTADKIVGLRGERKPPVSTVGIANPLHSR